MNRIPTTDLMVGEIPRWNLGVCEIRAVGSDGRTVNGSMMEEPDRITILGENGHPIGEIPLPGNPDEVASAIAEIVREEQESL